jgi:hypothetical protein
MHTDSKNAFFIIIIITILSFSRMPPLYCSVCSNLEGKGPAEKQAIPIKHGGKILQLLNAIHL